jgi:hypothetical protein
MQEENHDLDKENTGFKVEREVVKLPHVSEIERQRLIEAAS